MSVTGTARQEAKRDISIQLFPNPFSQYLKLKGRKPSVAAQLTIINIVGQVCKTIYFSPLADTEVTIDTRDLPAGVYLYKYQTWGASAETGRLIKMVD